MAQSTGSFSNNTTDKAHDKGRPTSGTNKCGNAQNEREEGNDPRAGERREKTKHTESRSRSFRPPMGE